MNTLQNTSPAASKKQPSTSPKMSKNTDPLCREALKLIADLKAQREANPDVPAKGLTTQDILSIETDRRDPATWNVIHLLRDGDYWHANEYSAWLAYVVVRDELQRRYPSWKPESWKVVKSYYKNIEGHIIFVGCKGGSFYKYIPEELRIGFHVVSNDQIDLAIELPAELGDITHDNLYAQFQAWKDSIPETKDDNKPADKNRPAMPRTLADLRPDSEARRMGLLGIVVQLLAFPAEQYSRDDILAFLTLVRQEIATHL